MDSIFQYHPLPQVCCCYQNSFLKMTSRDGTELRKWRFIPVCEVPRTTNWDEPLPLHKLAWVHEMCGSSLSPLCWRQLTKASRMERDLPCFLSAGGTFLIQFGALLPFPPVPPLFCSRVSCHQTQCLGCAPLGGLLPRPPSTGPIGQTPRIWTPNPTVILLPF